MRKRIVLILIVAAVMGLVASLLVYRVISQVVANASGGGSENVVVAAKDIGFAEAVTPQHVKLVAWPKPSIPVGALRTVAEAQGRVARTSIVAGEPLIEAKLAPQLSGKGGIMAMLVPDGQRAVTIKLDDATRESGFMFPNSRVDVLVSIAKTKGTDERIAKVILQDVPVLAAGQTVEMRDNKPVTVSTVTLSLTPEQTERLAVAQAEGRLLLTMRNLRDNQVVKTPGATPTKLLSDVGSAPAQPKPAVAAKPAPRPQVQLTAAPPPPPAPYTVELIRGGQVSEKVFVQSGENWVERPAQKK